MENEYLEDLPANCPPNDAEVINNDFVVYRLVDSIPPKLEDFYSVIKLDPKRKVKDKCIASGCSVFTDYDECFSKTKYTNLKKKKIIKFNLTNNIGRFKKSPNPDNKLHCTVWIYKSFLIKELNYGEENV